MDIMEKVLGIKNGEKFEHRDYRGYFLYLDGVIVNFYTDIEDKPQRMALEGEDVIRILSTPELANKLDYKIKLPKIIFEWLKTLGDKVDTIDIGEDFVSAYHFTGEIDGDGDNCYDEHFISVHTGLMHTEYDLTKEIFYLIYEPEGAK